jgi:hypothetical protein
MKDKKRTTALANIVSKSLIDEFTADPSLEHLNVVKLFGRNGEDVTINDDEIRQFPSLQ